MPKRSNRPERKQARHDSAVVRQEAYNALSDEEKMARAGAKEQRKIHERTGIKIPS